MALSPASALTALRPVRSLSSALAVIACLSLLLVSYRAESATEVMSEAAHAKAPRVRKKVWSVGVTGSRHSLVGSEGNDLVGNAATVQLGTGYISESWYFMGSLDILLGPQEPTRDGEVKVDHVGTGGTVWLGFSAQALNLRSPAGGYGFALGLSYADSVGRAVGRSNQAITESLASPTAEGSASNASSVSIENYLIRTTNFALLPAIFFSWLQPARPSGNTPDLLKTRLEGYLLTIGVGMPLVAFYQAQYDIRNPQLDIADDPPAAAEEEVSDFIRITERGSLRGYSILVTLTALLGT